jgi:hypothetical protein
MWGFERLVSGPNKGGYSHKDFVRGQPSRCRFMKRLKIKGIGNQRQGAATSPAYFRTPAPLDAGLAGCPKSIIARNNVGVASTTNMSLINSIMMMQQASKQADTSDIDLFDDESLRSVLCSVFQSPSKIETPPTEGDALLFEGMQFFFVEDTSPTMDNKQCRRMSIQVSQGVGKRRLSLINATNLFNSEGTNMSMDAFGKVGGYPHNRQIARRFSLQRSTSNGRNDFVLKQILDSHGDSSQSIMYT